MMDFEEIKQILALVREHELAEFELEHEGFKIRIRKDGVSPVITAPAVSPAVTDHAAAAAAAPAPEPAGPAAPDPIAPPEGELELAVVTSPIVGTFYRSPEPGARSFVEVGDVVKKGQVLCIIEAMKLMNEIDSEYEGEIVTVFVENGQPVQYGERLFAIKAR